MTISACPICLIRQDGQIPAKVVPVPPDCSEYGTGHLEQFLTLGELLLQENAEDQYNLDKEAIVMNTWIPTNTYCGGKAVLGISIALHSAGRMFRRYARYLYISEDPNGQRTLNIPC